MSEARVRKGVNMISTTGLRPASAAPTARPAMAASDTGVSRTRFGPKVSSSPAVGSMGLAWMPTPTPSPARNTAASRSISSRRA